MSKESVVFFSKNYSIINSRVALRVVPSSIPISVAFLLADLFLHAMQTYCGGPPPWPLEGERPRLEPDVGRKAPGWKHSFLPRENGTK